MRFSIELGYPLTQADALLQNYNNYKVYLKYRSKLLAITPELDLSTERTCTYKQLAKDMNDGLLDAQHNPIGLQNACAYYCTDATCDRLGIYSMIHTIVIDTKLQSMWLIPQYRRKPIDFREQIEETSWYLEAIDYLDDRLNM